MLAHEGKDGGSQRVPALHDCVECSSVKKAHGRLKLLASIRVR